MEEKIQKPGLMMVIKRPSLRQLSWLLGGSLLLCALFWLWLAVQQQEATLAIRRLARASVCRMVSPSGITSTLTVSFKSITPQKDGLLIKFDSTAQGAAAKEVLGRALPHGYIIALLEDDNSPTAGYPACATRRIGSGKRPSDCVFNAVWWFPHLLLCLNLRESTHSRLQRERVYPPGIP